MRLSTIVAGLLTLILVVSGFLIFLTDGVRTYAPANIPSNYNSSMVAIQNQVTSISDITNRTEVALKVKGNSGGNILDFIGFFFNAGYQGLQVAVESVKLNYLLVSEGADVIAGDTEYGNLLKAVGMLLVLLVIIFILMSIIFKWET